MKFRPYLIAAISLAIFVVLFFIFRTGKTPEKAEVWINNQNMFVDVAATDAVREKGLSGRDVMGINEGMIFLFDPEQKTVFWMKGMEFPLDILWVRDGKIVGVLENIDPQIGVKDSDLATLVSPEPVDQVLELHAGRAKSLRAKIGDTVRVRFVSKNS